MVISKLHNKLPLFLCLSLVLTLVLGGCNFPSAPEVTVTIKSAGGEGDGDEADSESGGDADEGAGSVAGYGNLVGRITYEGDVPSQSVLFAKGAAPKDPDVCGVQAILDESLQVDPATKGIADVVIYLAKKPKHIKPELANAELEPAVFDQKNCVFFPHVVPVRVDLNQPLMVLSDDSIAHNTHTFPTRNSGFNSAIPKNERNGIPISYTRAENEPVRVVCDLHAWMKAYHFPIDHPYFAVTAPDGTFRIEGLPAGKHAFKIWQEKGELLERKLEITIEPDTDTPLEKSYKF